MSSTNAHSGTLDHTRAKSAVLAHPDTVSVLQDQSERRRLNSYMKSMGIRGGPTNLAIFVEAIRRGIPITATRNRSIKLHGDSTYWWNNGATSLNHPAARKICPQKEVNSRIFRAQGIRAPENAVFSPGEAKRAWSWARPILPAVIKPYDGSKGQGVNTGLSKRSEFFRAFQEVETTFGHVMVEQQLAGTEHRVFLVGNQVKAALRQIPANIVGNGISTVSELIAEKNKTAIHPHKSIALNDIELRTLNNLRIAPNSVIDDGSRIFLRTNTNLSTGGDSIDATEELSDEERAFVKKAASCWPGLECAGFDVMLPRNPSDGPPAVLEINSSAGITAHLIPRFGQPRNVAESILDAMFPAISSPTQ